MIYVCLQAGCTSLGIQTLISLSARIRCEIYQFCRLLADHLHRPGAVDVVPLLSGPSSESLCEHLNATVVFFVVRLAARPVSVDGLVENCTVGPPERELLGRNRPEAEPKVAQPRFVDVTCVRFVRLYFAGFVVFGVQLCKV